MNETSQQTQHTKLRLVDLCSGTGAFSLAFRKTNLVECVFANDILPECREVHELNVPDAPFHVGSILDLSNASIPDHDVLTAGFPCQPFSIAGRREGFQDERSNVFWKILSILRDKKPMFVVLENVKNMCRHDNGRTLARIVDGLEDIGYHVTWKVLDACKVTGIPQHRERIYMIGVLDAQVFENISLDFPSVLKQDIEAYLQDPDEVPANFYYTNTSKIYEVLEQHVSRPFTIYQYRRVYVRENKSGECPTLTANMGTGGHNVPILLDGRGIRKLTPLECFRLQGFPDTYRLPAQMSVSKRYRLCGNAVSYPVIRLIADMICRAHRQHVMPCSLQT